MLQICFCACICFNFAKFSAKIFSHVVFLLAADSTCSALWLAAQHLSTLSQLIKVTNIKCESNKDIFSPQDISSCLNNYFTTIASKLANSLQKTSSPKPLNTVSSTCSSIFIKPIIDEDIIREINLLDNSKCDDTYDIPVKILKLSKYIIAPTLCYLTNYCINKGVFPNALKISKILPIYKGVERDIASNYRPISILPHFSKILEKILKHNLIDFIK